MPRYDLGDAQMVQLIAYLRTLTEKPSPGVTNAEFHFATVFTSPVKHEQRTAVLDVLKAYFADMNALTRNEKERLARGVWYRELRYKSYRRWRLHVWDLEGPEWSWRAQLDALYRKQAVFAVIGCVGVGDWSPVHRFCENNGIPCLMPNTDLPVIAPDDFYTIYFSKGL